MKPLLLDVKSLLRDSIHVKEIHAAQLDEGFHFHNACEIALILKSRGKRIIGDNIEDFTEGDLTLMGPNLPHVTYTNNIDSPNVHALVVYFHPDWLTESHLNSVDFVRLRELFEDINRGIKILGNTKKKVIRSLLRLKDSKGLQRIITILEILELISKSNEYVCLASKGYANSFTHNDVKRMDKVYNYVMEHFSEEIMLEDIAYIANLTPTAFCKFFKTKTNNTFSNFVNEIRIAFACKLLCDDNLSISQISFNCGFNNLTSFNKNFKQYTKMVPSIYRANINRKYF
jgi:AraC-like DNA-binding protein